VSSAVGDRARGEHVTTKLGDWIHRPLLGVDPDQAPFWDGLKDHEFLLCRCARCGTFWFPFTLCDRHPELVEFEDMIWTATSGRGTVYAKLVVHQVADPDFTAEVPYVLAMVALDEGPFFPARLIDCDVEEVEVGTLVEVTYVDSTESGQTLPLFRIAQ
jgi:uncharacterized protein